MRSRASRTWRRDLPRESRLNTSNLYLQLSTSCSTSSFFLFKHDSYIPARSDILIAMRIKSACARKALSSSSIHLSTSLSSATTINRQLLSISSRSFSITATSAASKRSKAAPSVRRALRCPPPASDSELKYLESALHGSPSGLQPFTASQVLQILRRALMKGMSGVSDAQTQQELQGIVFLFSHLVLLLPLSSKDLSGTRY